jgi:hypothetical protein
VPAAYEELAAPEQWNQYTSETAKYLARHLPNWRIPYMNVPINSPMRIDAAIREFGGGVGADIVNAPRLISKTGQALKGAVSGEGAGEDYTPSDLPVVGRLFRRGGVVGTGRSPQVTKFYEKLTEARQLSVSKERVETEEQRTARLNLEEANVAIKALRDGARDEKNAKKRDDMYRLLNDFARRALAGEQVYTPKKRTEREETQHERSREKREQRAIERWSGERKGEEGGSRGPTRRRPSLPTSPLAP